jgi:hypothetical protein
VSADGLVFISFGVDVDNSKILYFPKDELINHVPRLEAAIEAGEHYGPGVILHRHDKDRRHWLDLFHFIRYFDLPNADRSEAELIKAWVFGHCLDVPGFQNAVIMELLEKISDDRLEVDDSIVKHAYTTAVGSTLRVLIAEELLDQRNNIYPED